MDGQSRLESHLVAVPLVVDDVFVGRAHPVDLLAVLQMVAPAASARRMDLQKIARAEAVVAGRKGKIIICEMKTPRKFAADARCVQFAAAGNLRGVFISQIIMFPFRPATTAAARAIFCKSILRADAAGATICRTASKSTGCARPTKTSSTTSGTATR